eukprot:365947-Chlamydomonas_euryale.AAC.7
MRTDTHDNYSTLTTGKLEGKGPAALSPDEAYGFSSGTAAPSSVPSQRRQVQFPAACWPNQLLVFDSAHCFLHLITFSGGVTVGSGHARRC